MLDISIIYKFNTLTTIIGATTAVATSIMAYHFYLSVQLPGEAKVKWSWLPLLGDAINMGEKPLEFLLECTRSYGEIFGLVVGGNRLFLITDPHSSELIVKANTKELSTHEFHNQVLRNFFGVSDKTLSTSVGPMDDNLMRAWYSKYLYSDQGLESLTLRMQSYLFDKIEKCNTANKSNSEGTTVDMYPWVAAHIFEASLAALLSESAASSTGNASALLRQFMDFDSALPLTLAGCPLQYLKKSMAGRQAMYDAVNATDSTSACTLMQKRWELMNSLLTDGTMAQQDMEGLQLAIVWASVGNTIPTSFWLLYFLLVEADASVRERVNDEVSQGRDGEDGTFSQAALNAMTTLDACITETLRLTSGSMIMREVMHADVSLTLSSGNTYRFRKGDRVGICPPLAHLDGDIFTDAQCFNPDRWLPENVDETTLINASQGRLPEGTLFKHGKPLTSARTFLPFGGGVSLCPGRRFARNEIKALVASLLVTFDMEVVSNSSYRHSSPVNQHRPQFDGSRAGLGIFPPKESPKMHFKRRS